MFFYQDFGPCFKSYLKHHGYTLQDDVIKALFHHRSYHDLCLGLDSLNIIYHLDTTIQRNALLETQEGFVLVLFCYKQHTLIYNGYHHRIEWLLEDEPILFGLQIDLVGDYPYLRYEDLLVAKPVVMALLESCLFALAMLLGKPLLLLLAYPLILLLQIGMFLIKKKHYFDRDSCHYDTYVLLQRNVGKIYGDITLILGIMAYLFFQQPFHALLGIFIFLPHPWLFLLICMALNHLDVLSLSEGLLLILWMYEIYQLKVHLDAIKSTNIDDLIRHLQSRRHDVMMNELHMIQAGSLQVYQSCVIVDEMEMLHQTFKQLKQPLLYINGHKLIDYSFIDYRKDILYLETLLTLDVMQNAYRLFDKKELEFLMSLNDHQIILSLYTPLCQTSLHVREIYGFLYLLKQSYHFIFIENAFLFQSKEVILKLLTYIPSDKVVVLGVPNKIMMVENQVYDIMGLVEGESHGN